MVHPRLLWVLPLLLGAPGRAAVSPFGPIPPIVQSAPAPTAIDPDRQLPWRVFTWRDGVKPGNPQLAQDAQGYVWADGPVRYNGREWQAVTIPGEPGPQRIWTLLAARDGSLWFGYRQGGLLRLRAGVWTRYSPGGGLPAGFVNALAESAGGELWVGTATGLARCRDGRCSEEKSLRGVNVRCLVFTRTEAGRPALWIGTDRGLLLLEGADGAAPRLSPGFAEAAALPSLSIRSLAETDSPAGRSLWVGTDLGVARLQGGVWTRYDEGSGLRAPITALAASASPEGRPVVWAGTFSAGLLKIDEDGRWERYDTRSGLPSNYIYNLLVTRTGTGGRPTLWVSMPTSMARLDQERWRALDSRSGLPDDTVVGVGEATFPDGLHTYWIGTISGMVRQLPGGAWEKYSPFSPKPEVVLSAVDTREEDGTPAFWVGTVGGLYHFAHGRWTSRTARNSPPPLLQDWVLDVLTAPAERGTALWAGTRNGLARYERGSWTVFRSPGSGLPGNQIWALARSPGSGGGTVLWAGTERGLGRFERDRWEIVKVPCMLPAEITALRSVPDASGGGWLWIGTEGRGVARLRIDGGGHPRGPCEALSGRYLPSPFVVGIEQDAQGRVYLFTASGVVRLTIPSGRGLETARTELFNAGDGLPGMEFNRASFVDRRGRIWAGAIGGAAVLDPAPPEPAGPPGPPAPLRLDRILVDGRDRPLPPGTALQHDENNLEFRYALLSYRREQETRYRTQLVGLEARPSPWMSENRAVYSRLPRGEYRFRVWGRDNEGVVSGPVEVRFRIRPAAWLSAWAIALYALALIGLGYGASHLRVLARRTASLEAQVAARTRELAEANRRLELASLTDPLTGLSNRRFLAMRIVPEAPERRQPHEDLIFCFLDIDHFKQLNDRAGHAGGDEVLIETADRLRRTVRDTDTVIRWGGEEFLIVSPGADRSAGTVLAERLLAAVAGAPFVTRAGGRFTVTCSIGWAPYPWSPDAPDAVHYEQVMRLADNALYVAKREGRNRAVGVLPGTGGPGFPEGRLEDLEGTLVELVRTPGPPGGESREAEAAMMAR